MSERLGQTDVLQDLVRNYPRLDLRSTVTCILVSVPPDFVVSAALPLEGKSGIPQQPDQVATLVGHRRLDDVITLLHPGPLCRRWAGS
jgi:hypothetical protein